MMIALNRGEEFRMHVRAALNNGLAHEEIAVRRRCLIELLGCTRGEIAINRELGNGNQQGNTECIDT